MWMLQAGHFFLRPSPGIGAFMRLRFGLLQVALIPILCRPPRGLRAPIRLLSCSNRCLNMRMRQRCAMHWVFDLQLLRTCGIRGKSPILQPEQPLLQHPFPVILSLHTKGEAYTMKLSDALNSTAFADHFVWTGISTGSRA